MSAIGNDNGANHLLRQPQKKAATPPTPTIPEGKQAAVTFNLQEGEALRGSLTRMTRLVTVFELYNPSVIPRLSEVLNDFKIIIQDKAPYCGRAIVRNIVDAGTKVTCEAALEDSHWVDVDLRALAKPDDNLAEQFKLFISDWQKQYRVLSEFKVVIADMQTFFHELRLWLDQLELGITATPLASRAELEKSVMINLTQPAVQAIDSLIEQFESIVSVLEKERHPAHQAHLRRQLHPLVLGSPFARRAFEKPLGYAGDYQMVDMMIRPPFEGRDLFSKIINIWLLGQTPAQAHRNRVDHLERCLIQETMRAKAAGRTLRVFNLGCGPAAEIQRFFKNQTVSRSANLTLVDFNQETLDFLRQTLEGIKRSHNGSPSYRLMKKSVNQILKEGRTATRHGGHEQYDYIYCAGLFDYLSDDVCKQLMNIFYNMLAPGGLLLATNASDVLNDSRPFRYSMEYILDWYLIYRNKTEFAQIAPDLADEDYVSISAEATGANLFLEVRKPKNA